MLSILDTLKVDLENMDPAGLMGPDTDLNEEKERVVGEADPDIQKLFFLIASLERAKMKIVADAMFMGNGPKKEELVEKVSMLDEKATLFRAIMWASIRETHSLWGKPVVGIRTGWKIFWSDEVQNPFCPSLSEMLAHLRKFPV
jgi:hypothetical protein